MRITKKYLRDIKSKLTAFVVETHSLNHKQLKQSVMDALPNAVIHITGCPNCGADQDTTAPSGYTVYKCMCSQAEITAARVDQSERECIKILTILKIDELIPSSVVD